MLIVNYVVTYPRVLSLAAAAEQKGAADGTTIFDETLNCVICMNLCSRPITVTSRLPNCVTARCCHACLLNAFSSIQAFQCSSTEGGCSRGAGTLPAQLLPGLLQPLGGARQEDVPHLPPRLPRQVRRQPAHQHAAGVRHPHGQAGAARPGRQGRHGARMPAEQHLVCWLHSGG